MIELINQLQFTKEYWDIRKYYLDTLPKDVEYLAYSLNNNLEIVECRGIVNYEERWNYHNNYDDGDYELFVIVNNIKRKGWFSLKREDVVAFQKVNIEIWKTTLLNELNRLNRLS